MRKKELIERYESLLIGHKYLLKSSVIQDEQIKAYMLRIGELEFENQALRDALKIATTNPEVEPWKIALDDDIEQYILKEGQDGGQKDTRRLLRE